MPYKKNFHKQEAEKKTPSKRDFFNSFRKQTEKEKSKPFRGAQPHVSFTYRYLKE